jgi:predicted O-methyltransferase YrrM
MKLKLLTFLLLGISHLQAKEAVHIDFEQVCQAPYTNDAILRKDPLFTDDFLTLHSLLRRAEPASVFEIGTCTGEGTQIIKNAVGESVVYSLELPQGQSSYDISKIGEACSLPYVQLLGDSSTFPYSEYHPIEAWFIDGAHDYEHVFYETKQALLSHPTLIVWHDADIQEVFEGIKDGLDESEYTLFRVDHTRIAFAIASTSELAESLHD